MATALVAWLRRKKRTAWSQERPPTTLGAPAHANIKEPRWTERAHRVPIQGGEGRADCFGGAARSDEEGALEL